MKRTSVFVFISAVVIFLAAVFAGCTSHDTGNAASPATNTSSLTQEEAEQIGTDVYVYAYPLVTMEMTRKILTNVKVPDATGRAPENQFSNRQSLPDPADKAVVRLNLDTLYSTAWLNVSSEPLILSVPDTGERFYMMPILSGWTNVVASPGKRTTGTGPGEFAITGPDWKGTLPMNVTEIKSPTNMVWILGRTQTDGPTDYDAVHALQAQYRLTPLSAYGKPYTPPNGTVDSSIDMTTSTLEQVNAMNASSFFTLFAGLLKDNPPAAEDVQMVKEMEKIGIVPGKAFDLDSLDPTVAAGLERAPKDGQERIVAFIPKMGTRTPTNWVFSLDLGNFGTNYDLRAATAYTGLGANIAADAIYPSVKVDRTGVFINGSHTYALHFNKSDLDVANAFWSVTMYDAQGFMVPNSIDRYAISSWMPVNYNPDGSLDIYIQNTTPGQNRTGNWLPAPEGDFTMTLRIYWPKEQVLNGSWYPPAVVRTD
ncbi:MAG: DUF1254 domain-containing protein [Methanoregula sp.]|jgi:hypothetical protein